jgi:hypothetical protein
MLRHAPVRQAMSALAMSSRNQDDCDPVPIREDRRIFARSIEEAEAARHTDSLRKEQAAMNAPEEKKSQTGNARGDHVNGSVGRREPLLTSTPGMFGDDSDLQEPRHRLLNDADSIPEPSLHAKKPARGSSWPAGAVSFSTVAAILFLMWGGIELMTAPERIDRVESASRWIRQCRPGWGGDATGHPF